MKKQDKKKYRNKGTGQTVIKTACGKGLIRELYMKLPEKTEVNGSYMLDKTLEPGNASLISMNMEQVLKRDYS